MFKGMVDSIKRIEDSSEVLLLETEKILTEDSLALANYDEVVKVSSEKKEMNFRNAVQNYNPISTGTEDGFDIVQAAVGSSVVGGLSILGKAYDLRPVKYNTLINNDEEKKVLLSLRLRSSIEGESSMKTSTLKTLAVLDKANVAIHYSPEISFTIEALSNEVSEDLDNLFMIRSLISNISRAFAVSRFIKLDSKESAKNRQLNNYMYYASKEALGNLITNLPNDEQIILRKKLQEKIPMMTIGDMRMVLDTYSTLSVHVVDMQSLDELKGFYSDNFANGSERKKYKTINADKYMVLTHYLSDLSSPYVSPIYSDDEVEAKRLTDYIKLYDLCIATALSACDLQRRSKELVSINMGPIRETEVDAIKKLSAVDMSNPRYIDNLLSITETEKFDAECRGREVSARIAETLDDDKRLKLFSKMNQFSGIQAAQFLKDEGTMKTTVFSGGDAK